MSSSTHTSAGGAGGSRAGAGYRPYCDECGEKLWSYPITLQRARLVGQAHANGHGHPVRIEPWDSYALVEGIVPAELEDGNATPSDRRRASGE